MHTKFCYKNLKERDRLEDLGAAGWITLKSILKKWEGVNTVMEFSGSEGMY
jgi:hypothetical protein